MLSTQGLRITPKKAQTSHSLPTQRRRSNLFWKIIVGMLQAVTWTVPCDSHVWTESQARIESETPLMLCESLLSRHRFVPKSSLRYPAWIPQIQRAMNMRRRKVRIWCTRGDLPVAIPSRVANEKHREPERTVKFSHANSMKNIAPAR